MITVLEWVGWTITLIAGAGFIGLATRGVELYSWPMLRVALILLVGLGLATLGVAVNRDRSQERFDRACHAAGGISYRYSNHGLCLRPGSIIRL